MVIEVRRLNSGAWCVIIDGQFISDHATHEAARITAQRHAVLAQSPQERDSNDSNR